MLTLEMLKQMPANTVFATGVLTDNEDDLFMTGSNKELCWIAVCGENVDWCIYCHWADKDIDWLRKFGDKVLDERNIKRCVACNDEAFKRYRY